MLCRSPSLLVSSQCAHTFKILSEKYFEIKGQKNTFKSLSENTLKLNEKKYLEKFVRIFFSKFDEEDVLQTFMRTNFKIKSLQVFMKDTLNKLKHLKVHT